MAKATGGTITTNGDYTIHEFTSSGTFTPTSTGMDIDVLVVAGGGSGGYGAAGGGGAGGLTFQTGRSATAGTGYTVTVGAGGAGQGSLNTPGNNGSNSVFDTTTAIGGGAGGSWSSQAGGAGGSGGGGGDATGAAGSANQGDSGGGTGFGNDGGGGDQGGGGGAGAVGTVATPEGGAGKDYSATFGTGVGVSGLFAGGGDGFDGTGGGGSGGGGASDTAGTANTGGGGGGSNTGTSGAGGTGVVVIRYLTALSAEWSNSAEIQSDNTKVSGSGDHTDFPALIADGNLSSAVYAGLNSMNKSLDLELSSSQYAGIADGSQTGLDITGDITIEAWIKIEQLPSTAGTDFTIAGKYLVTGDQRGYWIDIENSDDGLELFYSQDGGFTNLTRLQTTSAIVVAGDVGNWVHIAVAVDVSATSMTVYKDGVSQTTGSITTGATSIFDGTGDFRIGSRGSGADYFDGKVAVVRVWDDIRTEAEVQSNRYNLGLTTGTDNLIDVWKLDNGYTSESGNNTLTASGSPVFSADSPIGATDLRITTDSAGTTEIPFEIVTLDTAAETSEIHAKVPTLEYDAATSLFIWYGNSSALPYAADDTYGSEAVWSDYGMVYHLESLTADSTANALTLTNNSVIADSSSMIGSGADFGSGNTTTYLNHGSNPMTNQTVTINFWAKRGTEISTGTTEMIDYRRNPSVGLRINFQYEYNSGTRRILLGINDVSHGDNYYTTQTLGTTWHHFSIVYDLSGTNLYLYIDGDTTPVIDEAWTAAGASGWSDVLEIGRFQERYMDEATFADTARSADWVATEYNNQNSPSTFWSSPSTGVAVLIGGGIIG